MGFDISQGNADDSRAARLALLGALFMSERAALPTARIYELFYEDAASPEAAAKAFSRDREALAQIGVRVNGVGGSRAQRRWELDPSSLAADEPLGAQEAIVLNAACQPLLEEPGFPLLEDLRFALAKVDQNFYDPERAVELRAAPATRKESVIDECLKRGCAIKIEYRNAQGRSRTGVFAPQGTFSFRKKAYLVAAPLDREEEAGVLTLRLDRMGRVSAQRNIRVDVPADFDPQAHIKLPFQFGPTTCTGRFFVPIDAVGALKAESAGKGTFDNEDSPTSWEAPVSDLTVAAAWAIAVGIRPTAPQELVDAWREQLKKEVNHV